VKKEKYSIFYIKTYKRNKKMKKGIFIEHNKFANWYLLKSMEAEALVNTSTAARLLGVKMPYVYQLWKEKKIKRYVFENPERKREIAYYGIKEIMEIVSLKEQMFDAEKDTNQEVVDLSNYPSPEVYNWHKEYWPDPNGPKLKEYLDFKLKHWEKNNPEKAKIFKKNPKGEINIIKIMN
jgi:hypothetical protein